MYNELSASGSFAFRLSQGDVGLLKSVLANLKIENKFTCEFYRDNDGRVVCNLFKSSSPEISIGRDKNCSEISSALSEALIKNKISLTYGNNTGAPTSFSTIYHEFGHLQDIERIPTRALTIDQVEKGAKMPAALKEWLDNSEAQKVARKVSWYSTQGPSEFIADVFAGLMEGNKFSDDVMALYRKLHGPSIPGIV